MEAFMGWKIDKFDWEDDLLNCSNKIIRETGLSRERLYTALHVLSEEGIIKAKIIN
ncbi:hypothetical protein [Halalkalibacter oceani]|uniref:hypothetical protein n=1 Tax=Halalkalibacter oceani TaxID=1653776 RepID=UPI0033984FED